MLVAAGVWSLTAQLFVFPAETQSSDWAPAAEYVLERIEQGDRIRTHPPWNIDALPYVESVGDQVDRRHNPVLEDIYRADRIWVLSETARVEEAIRRLPYEPVDLHIERFGDAAVVRAPLPDSANFSWEALEHLSEAQVERVEPSEDGAPSIRECESWSEENRRWDCGSRDPWLYVGEVERFLGGDYRRAIWAHPVPDDEYLRVTFPEVPMGELLRVRAGFTFLASRKDRGAPVTMEVRLDGEVLEEKTYPTLETTWEPIDFETPERAGKSAELSIVVRTPDITDRYFCFNAWVR